MKRLWWTALILLVLSLIGYLAFKYINNTRPPVRPMPEKRPAKNLIYYEIIDQATGEVLMVTSSGPVEVGDELITDTNRRYIVIRVKGTKAYAKYIETVKMPTGSKF